MVALKIEHLEDSDDEVDSLFEKLYREIEQSKKARDLAEARALELRKVIRRKHGRVDSDTFRAALSMPPPPPSE